MHRDETTLNSHASRIARAPGRARFGAAIGAALLALSACGPGTASPAPATVGATTPGATTPAATTSAWQPTGPITIVVPFAAGGPTDTVTRQIAAPMGTALGQQIIISNVAGAGGTLAAGQVAEAAADGYTVLMHHIGMSTAPTLYPELEYDPLTSFKTIGLVTEVPMTIIGGTEFEPNNLQELVDYAKANAATVNYANAGVGAASHLCGLLLEEAIGVDWTEVPYDGTGPAMDDLLGNQVDFMCDQTTNTTTQIKAGTVKAYAITSPERNDALPDVPTTTEAGLPDVQVRVWHGLYVPAETPDDVVAALTAALQAALADPTVIAEFAKLGTTPVSADQATPAAHSALLAAQIEVWRPLLEGAGG
jgi:tripartite-type tricarboxylate transporter receptor subunit TctC